LNSNDIFYLILDKETDESKLNLVEKYKTKLAPDNIVDLSYHMETDKGIIGLLDICAYKLKGDEIAQIIEELRSDESKLNLLEKYIDKLTDKLGDIIEKIHDDEIKIKLTEKYKEELSPMGDIYFIIFSMNNDESKINLLEKYKDDFPGFIIGEIILKLKKDENKIKLLETYKDESAEFKINDIIGSINSEELKIDLIGKYNLTPEDIAVVIGRSTSKEAKINLLERYESRLSGEDIAIAIGYSENKDIRNSLLEKYEDQLTGDNIVSISGHLDKDSEKGALIEKYKGEKLTGRHIVDIRWQMSGRNRQVALNKYKSIIDEYIKEIFTGIGTPIDNLEELYTNFGGAVFDNIPLITKECEQILGKDELYSLIKYYIFEEKMGVDKIIENPEDFKKYEVFRKMLYSQKQMPVMDMHDAIVEFNDNSKLIKECLNGELTAQETSMLKVVIKEKEIEINSKEELKAFPQKRHEKIEEMINSNSNGAIIYLLTGMTEKEYDEKLKLYINANQINSTISDFDELDSELSVIRVANEFIELIKGMDEEKRKEVLNIYNNDLANEFSQDGSSIANVRAAFEDIEVKIRKVYGKELAKSLDEVELPESKKSYKDVEIIELKGEEFKLLVHGIDAYGEGTGKFEKREVGQSYICTSLISNQKLDRAEAKRYYGFRNIGSNALVQEGKSDIHSVAKKDNSLKVTAKRGMEFDLTEDLVEGEYYNEVDLWREYLGDDGEMKDIWPEYVVCFNKITNGDIMEAKRLNIPIVLIDEKVYEKNVDKNKEVKEEVSKEENEMKMPEEYDKTRKSMLEILRESASRCSALSQQEALTKIIAEMEKKLEQEKEVVH